MTLTLHQKKTMPMKHQLVLAIAHEHGYAFTGNSHEPVEETMARLDRMSRENPRVAHWYGLADTVLKVMGEPKDAMIDAGVRILEQHSRGNLGWLAGAVFREMALAAREGK